MLEYTLTADDRVAFELWVLRRDGKLRALRRRNRRVGACVLIGLCMPLAFLTGNPVGRLLAFAVLASTSVLLWYGLTAVWPDHTERVVRRRLTRRFQRGKAPTSVVRTWLDDTGMTVSTSDSVSVHRSWAGIRSVEETPEHYFVFVAGKLAQVLPRRADPLQVPVMADQIRAHLRPAAAPPSAPGGIRHSTPGAGPEPAASGQPIGTSVPVPPDGWLPAGVVPLSRFAAGAAATAGVPGPAVGTLSFRLGVDDLVAASMGRPSNRQAFETAASARAWRSVRRTLPTSIPLLLLANLTVLKLGLGWAVVVAVGTALVAGGVQWSEVRGRMMRTLPAALEKRARQTLAEYGDQRTVHSNAGGVTIVDAVRTRYAPWRRVQLVELDRHLLLLIPGSALPIPRSLGAPVVAFAWFARARMSAQTGATAPGAP